MPQLCSLERFLKDTATHALTVVKDDGVHRHLQFRRPGTYCYGFDIVTWPGYLAISGDMGAAVFSRLNDMFDFFRDRPGTQDPGPLHINPGYWAEKCVANDGPHKEFHSESLQAYVDKAFKAFVEENDATGSEEADDLWLQLEEEVLLQETTHDAIVALTEFEGDEEVDLKLTFPDAWELARQFEVYTFHFIWRLYAIAFAVRAYDAAKPAHPPRRGDVIHLLPAELQSGLDRVRWAENLIRQLPEDHDGRNSWLLNYGSSEATPCSR